MTQTRNSGAAGHLGRSFHRRCLTGVGIFGVLLLLTANATAGELFVGAASVDITPTGPTAIAGQTWLRVSGKIETPLTANVLALESRDGDKPVDAAIAISCDVLFASSAVLDAVRREVKKKLPNLDVTKIFLSSTHTHTAPLLASGECSQWYQVPKQGVVQVADYHAFLVRRVADAVVSAWNGRTPGSVAWGLGHAVVGYNRRAVFANGSAQLNPATTGVPEFRNIEGREDHDIGALFFWNKAGKLISIVVNVSCPAQEVEGRSAINADYWHPVRESLHKRYGPDVCVLGWIGAAGDQSPHLLYRRAADDRMTRLRGLDRLDEIGRRVCVAVDEVYEAVKNDRRADAALIHNVETFRLPMWRVTDGQYAEAKAACAPGAAYPTVKWYETVLHRYDNQKKNPNPTLDTEVHVLRLGDAAICTNRFELFTDYGIQIKARSKAEQTFVVELTGDGTYLPTAEAVRGGDYSAIAPSCVVGPEGGQVLVDRTVEAINALWKKSN